MSHLSARSCSAACCAMWRCRQQPEPSSTTSGASCQKEGRACHPHGVRLRLLRRLRLPRLPLLLAAQPGQLAWRPRLCVRVWSAARVMGSARGKAAGALTAIARRCPTAQAQLLEQRAPVVLLGAACLGGVDTRGCSVTCASLAGLPCMIPVGAALRLHPLAPAGTEVARVTRIAAHPHQPRHPRRCPRCTAAACRRRPCWRAAAASAHVSKGCRGVQHWRLLTFKTLLLAGQGGDLRAAKRTAPLPCCCARPGSPPSVGNRHTCGTCRLTWEAGSSSSSSSASAASASLAPAPPAAPRGELGTCHRGALARVYRNWGSEAQAGHCRGVAGAQTAPGTSVSRAAAPPHPGSAH